MPGDADRALEAAKHEAADSSAVIVF